MKWKILVEQFVESIAVDPETGDQRSEFKSEFVPIDDVYNLWDDGFAADGSQWGDAESDAVQTHLNMLKLADQKHRCYAAEKAT